MLRTREFVQFKETSFLNRCTTLRSTLHFQFHSRLAARILISLWKDTCAPVPINNPFYPCLPRLSSFSISFPTREDTYFKFYESKLTRFRCVIRTLPSNFVSINTTLPWVLFWFTVCRKFQCEFGRFDSLCQRVLANFVIQLQLAAKYSLILYCEITWKLKTSILYTYASYNAGKKNRENPLLYHVYSVNYHFWPFAFRMIKKLNCMCCFLL